MEWIHFIEMRISNKVKRVDAGFRIFGVVRQGCTIIRIISPWLFSLNMDGVLRQIRVEVSDDGVEIWIDDVQ